MSSLGRPVRQTIDPDQQQAMHITPIISTPAFGAGNVESDGLEQTPIARQGSLDNVTSEQLQKQVK